MRIVLGVDEFAEGQVTEDGSLSVVPGSRSQHMTGRKRPAPAAVREPPMRRHEQKVAGLLPSHAQLANVHRVSEVVFSQIVRDLSTLEDGPYVEFLAG